MRAVITVIGKDKVGVLAKISTVCENYNVNVLEVSQSIMQELFAMIMLVDIDKLNANLQTFTKKLEDVSAQIGMKIHVMHEDIFNAMHKI